MKAAGVLPANLGAAHALDGGLDGGGWEGGLEDGLQVCGVGVEVKPEHAVAGGEGVAEAEDFEVGGGRGGGYGWDGGVG